MRITHSTMYRTMANNMGNSLASYMNSNIQGSSQKRINAPSDDPVGMSRILTYRAAIERNKQYETNSADVSSMLASTDNALTQAEVILTTIREKAEQASSGSYTAENRMQIANEIRQLFGQLINLANTEFNGQHLFAGHRTGSPAYEQGLGITTTDANLLNALRNDGTTAQVPWTVTGEAASTIQVRFDSVNGANGPGNTGVIGVDTIEYSYSKDGGKTWIAGTSPLGPGDYDIDLDGATITFPQPGTDPKDLAAGVTITTGSDVAEDQGTENGSMLYVRPTAYYMGDDNDPPPIIDIYGSSRIDNVSASGTFSGDVRIRLDSAADVSVDGKVAYSYSTDNGITWIQGTPADTKAGGNSLRLDVPGGYIDVYPSNPPQTLDAGQQFVVRPRRADQGIEINKGEFMSTTNSGKDIFGGLYTAPGQKVPEPAADDPKNIFETISNFIAYLECNSQTGCQETFADIKTATDGLVTQMTKVGGKVNRVELNLNMLESQTDDNTSRMSKIEDIDFLELMNNLQRQQMAYQTVLQSSSMIMGLNLTNFL